MAKLSKDTDCTEEALALEMIELNIEEWGTLTRVFDMISNVCAELQGVNPAPVSDIDDEMIH